MFGAHRPIRFIAASALISVLIYSAVLAQDLPVFKDVAGASGIDFVHSFGDEHMSWILEATGPGCGFIDYDVDGDLDLYFVNGSYLEGINDPYPEGRDPKQELRNRLYRNRGDGMFADVTEAAGVGDTGYGMGCVVGDYDNDGYPDLYITNYGPNVLYRNNGDGTFTDVTEEAGVGCDLWSVGVTFLDYDGDGYLDLYVGNYLDFDPEYQIYFSPDAFPGPLAYEGLPDVLYQNNRDGTFTDVTEAAGVYNPDGRAMGLTSADFDNDGDMDIFVCNDNTENFLYQNNRDGTFTDVAFERGAAFGDFGEATSAMGPDFGDYDNDGDLDVFVPDMSYSCLYRNNGDRFEDVTARVGIAEVCGQYTGWATTFFDYDNDGYLDLYVTNGDPHNMYTEEDLLFHNNRDGTFEDVSMSSGGYFTHAEYIGRGAAFGDCDNDGDIDISIGNVHGPAVLLRNEGGNRNHWLMVKTVGTKSNRDGIGARITVVAGGTTRIGEVRAGSSYLSQNDPRVHFGLGSSEKVDRLTIRWPSGIVQVLENVDADQVVTVREE